MAYQSLNLTPGTADSEPTGGTKINANFVELYGATGVTPQMYGAVADGVTDDSAAFTSAINACVASAGNKALIVPAGKYRAKLTINPPLGNPYGLRIVGAGINATVITAISATADAITWSPGQSIWGGTIENMTLQGLGANLVSVAITGTAGQFSCAATNLAVGYMVSIGGVYGGTGSITGYASYNQYLVSAVPDSTHFTLTTMAGAAIVTTAGTPTGLSFTSTAALTLAGVAITGTAGQFSCTASTLAIGNRVVLAGTYGGTGSITGYVNPTTYIVSATPDSTHFTLVTTALAALVTTAGTPTGIKYTLTGGNGIHVPLGLNFPPFNMGFTQLLCQGFGNSGIYDEAGMFSFRIRECVSTLNAGHQFDFAGGNAFTMLSCYGQVSPTPGTCLYRIRAGRPTLLGCTGVNLAQYWGIFGSSVALDGTLNYCVPTLIGCNLEDFDLVGMQMRGSSPVLINTTLIAPVAGSGIKAINYDAQPNNSGTLIDSAFSTKGATWANSQAIHCRNTGPFGLYISDGLSSNYSFYDDQNTTAFTSPQIGNINPRFAVQAFYLSDFKADTCYIGVGGVINTNYVAGNTGATPAPNWANGPQQSWTLNASTTWGAPTGSPVIGQTLTLLVSATGAFTTAWTVTAGGYRNAPAWAVAANGQKATANFMWDGSNWQFIGGSTAFA